MLEHIAIATKNPGLFIQNFVNLGFIYKGFEIIEGEGVKTHFLIKENLKIELLEPLREDSKINKFIEKKGETFHHIAINVKDLKKEMEILKNLGYEFVREEPVKGAEDKLIAFLHPKTFSGILVELCEEENEDK